MQGFRWTTEDLTWYVRNVFWTPKGLGKMCSASLRIIFKSIVVGASVCVSHDYSKCKLNLTDILVRLYAISGK